MSPTSSPRQPGAGGGAGVARHAAFKVHRDSHSIHKATSPLSSGSGSTNSSVSSPSNAIITSSSHHRPAPAPQPPRRQQQQQPSRPWRAPSAGRVNSGSVVAAAPQDESSSSSSESCANTTHAAGPPPYADSQLMPPLPAPPLDAHFMAPDIPLLFAPDAAASDLQQLCAPRGLYGQFPPPVDAVATIGPVMSTNMNSAASNGGAVFSPSMVETVRTFSGYN
ncbi:unnamed protein product [Miscanthus lutarioriparius]|uniref:Uncharacterized protein n=1 Tax=Miscanthus lutarioriparius TaxID=422564 RepID=A0A811MTU1_9POAL|nr:unnamed protein product [Miscanthus lutarioriparius]